MRIHLGHHFYGAGNLGDDFMLAGFLTAMQSLAPTATFTACVPFPLPPLQQRFPAVEWRPYSAAARRTSIAQCDAWLGLGGSPFQSAQSRWFVDHLLGDQAFCREASKPMFFLGVGIQTDRELDLPEVRSLCTASAAIWTRDAASATRLARLSPAVRVAAAADLAHLFFAQAAPPPARSGRVTLVANFDFGAWPGQADCLDAINGLAASEHVWLAQESRELPGAEKALFSALPSSDRLIWSLVSPERLGAPLDEVLSRWPSGEWLVTSRFHAALAGAWAGSRVVIISTNDKLRSVAAELGLPSIAIAADVPTVTAALASAIPLKRPTGLADLAFNACREFVGALPKPS